MDKISSLDFDASALAGLATSFGTLLEGAHDGRGRRVGVACARFNGSITLRLLGGALAALGEAGVARHDITLAWAPGAYELPMLAQGLIRSSAHVDAVIALGAVVRGETTHYDLVAGECARGLQDVQLRSGVPVVFGVLTTENVEQALERSRPDSTNKGREAAFTALEMVSLLSGALAPRS